MTDRKRQRAPGAGRKPAAPGTKRSRNVTVWLTADHHAACVAAADRVGLSMSDWMAAASERALAEDASELAAEIAQEERAVLEMESSPVLARRRCGDGGH